LARSLAYACLAERSEALDAPCIDYYSAENAAVITGVFRQDDPCKKAV